MCSPKRSSPARDAVVRLQRHGLLAVRTATFWIRPCALPERLESTGGSAKTSRRVPYAEFSRRIASAGADSVVPRVVRHEAGVRAREACRSLAT